MDNSARLSERSGFKQWDTTDGGKIFAKMTPQKSKTQCCGWRLSVTMITTPQMQLPLKTANRRKPVIPNANSGSNREKTHHHDE
jgi:hypothetical protein